MSVSPRLQQRKRSERKERKGSGGVPVRQVQGEERRGWKLRERASKKSL